MAAIVGPLHDYNQKFASEDINLPKRDFIGNLYKEATKQCFQFLNEDSRSNNIKACQRELMIASSCVLLKKANANLGDLRDCVGDCKYEINITQKNLIETYPEFPVTKMNTWLRNLSLSIYTFA